MVYSSLSNRKPVPEVQQEPGEILTGFFDRFHLEEVKEMLQKAKTRVIRKRWVIKKADKIENDNWLFFFEQMEKLVEAAYMMR